MFYVMRVEAGSELPTLIAIQRLGSWTCSNHVESILDPSCHTWTLKYACQWKVLFIFLFAQASHRKWSSVFPASDFLFDSKISLNPQQLYEEQQFAELADRAPPLLWALWSRPSARDLPLSPRYSLPSLHISHMGNEDGELTLVFFHFVHSEQPGPFMGCTTVAAFPGEGIHHHRAWPRGLQGRPERTAGVTLVAREVCFVYRGGDKAKREGTGLERKEVTKSGRSKHRVQTGLCGQDLWGRAQSSTSLLERWKYKGRSL